MLSVWHSNSMKSLSFFILGFLYFSPTARAAEKPVEFENKLKMHKSKCAQDSAADCYMTFGFLTGGDLSKAPPTEQIEVLEKSAQLGDIRAIKLIMSFYFKGFGVEKSLEKGKILG